MVKLTNDQMKLLLVQVEASPLPREDVKLRDICDRSPHFFGASGSDLRRSFQKKWTYLKRLPPLEYCERVVRMGIRPSESTRKACLDSVKDIQCNEKMNTTKFQEIIDKTIHQCETGSLDNKFVDNISTANDNEDGAVPLCSPSPTHREKKSRSGDHSKCEVFGGER